MSGETEKAVSGWTTDTLHSHVQRLLVEMDHRYEDRFKAQELALANALTAHEKTITAVNQLIDTAIQRVKDQAGERAVAQDKAVDAALEAAKEAVVKAETANEKRFDAVNEFRQTLADQTSTFLPRPEYNALHTQLEQRVDTNTKQLDELRGRGSGVSEVQKSQDRNRALIFAIIGVIISLAVIAASNVSRLNSASNHQIVCTTTAPGNTVCK